MPELATIEGSTMRWCNAGLGDLGREILTNVLGTTGLVKQCHPFVAEGLDLPRLPFDKYDLNVVESRAYHYAREAASDGFIGVQFDIDTASAELDFIRWQIDSATDSPKNLPAQHVHPNWRPDPSKPKPSAEERRERVLKMSRDYSAFLNAMSRGSVRGCLDGEVRPPIVTKWGEPEGKSIQGEDDFEEWLTLSVERRGEESPFYEMTRVCPTVYAQGSIEKTVAMTERSVRTAMLLGTRHRENPVFCVCPHIPEDAWGSAVAPKFTAVPVELFEAQLQAVARESIQAGMGMVDLMVWFGLARNNRISDAHREQAEQGLRNLAEACRRVFPAPQPEPAPEPTPETDEDLQAIRASASRLAMQTQLMANEASQHFEQVKKAVPVASQEADVE